MSDFKRSLYLLSLKGVDQVAMMVAFLLAFLLVWRSYHPVDLSEFFEMRVKLVNLIVMIGFLGCWYLIFLANGLYLSMRLTSFRSEAVSVFLACFLGTLVVGGGGWLASVQVINGQFLAAFFGIVVLLTLGFRFAFRSALRVLRLRGRNLRFLLVAGTNNRAVEFARQIKDRSDLGYRLVGFVDEAWSGAEPSAAFPAPLVCSPQSFHTYVRDHVVDEVVICLPMRSQYQAAASIIDTCREQGVTARYNAQVFHQAADEANGSDPLLDSLVTASTNLIQDWPGLIKRFLDLLLSLVALVLLSPFLAAIAIAIKLTSKGPVLFAQPRIGLNKRQFKLFKFRTMTPEADALKADLSAQNQMDGPVFKIARDPRVTPLGAFLRKYSLDELPQLINVLRGEMSLVGPRPLVVDEHRALPERWQIRRCSIRPGMTGLWQVSGRSNLSFDEWMRLDMTYIDSWSLTLDWKILLKTVWVVITGKGAC